MSQILIKTLLIIAFAAVALYLVAPISGQRGLAIRKILYVLFFVAAVLSVIFPSWISSVALLLGIGRGTDLILYGLVVVFLGVSFSLRRRTKIQESAITQLARAVAVESPAYPPKSGR